MDPFWLELEGDSGHFRMMGGKGEMIKNGKKSSWDVTETVLEGLMRTSCV